MTDCTWCGGKGEYDNGDVCIRCGGTGREPKDNAKRRPDVRPGVFDLRKTLGRAPTVAEFRATRGHNR